MYVSFSYQENSLKTTFLKAENDSDVPLYLEGNERSNIDEVSKCYICTFLNDMVECVFLLHFWFIVTVQLYYLHLYYYAQYIVLHPPQLSHLDFYDGRYE